MTNLKEARESGDLGKFIKEHKRDPKGDKEALDRGLASMAGKSSSSPKTSSRPARDD